MPFGCFFPLLRFLVLDGLGCSDRIRDNLGAGWRRANIFLAKSADELDFLIHNHFLLGGVYSISTGTRLLDWMSCCLRMCSSSRGVAIIGRIAMCSGFLTRLNAYRIRRTSPLTQC